MTSALGKVLSSLESNVTLDCPLEKGCVSEKSTRFISYL